MRFTRGRIGALGLSLLGLCLSLLGAVADANQTDCDRINEASRSSRGQTVGIDSKLAGLDLSSEAQSIFDHPDSQVCDLVHEVAVDGEPAIMYRQRQSAQFGSTDSMIWVSKKTGLLLREEIDIEVPGKGKGHQSIRFNYAPSADSQ